MQNRKNLTTSGQTKVFRSEFKIFALQVWRAIGSQTGTLVLSMIMFLMGFIYGLYVMNAPVN